MQCLIWQHCSPIAYRKHAAKVSARMALLHQSAHRLCQLLQSQALRAGALHVSQRPFSAEPAPSQSDDSLTVTVNPFKGHRLEPPSRDVQTSKQELLDMFEVSLLNRSSACITRIARKSCPQTRQLHIIT